jgi:surface repeat SSSPR-51 protein
MSSTIKKILKNRAGLALAVAGVSPVVTVAPVSAEVAQVSAGSFDLTKQATEATFPVMFDRPTGINAAAIASTVRNLGTSSELYKKAVAEVPEIADSAVVSSLLNDALSPDQATSTKAKTTIVKIINWYNSLGGQKITTQSGEAYTVANLDQPINTLAVAFSNDGTINSQVSTTITNEFKNVKTVQDVMNIFNKYKAGTSNSYQQAFDSYASKVYAPNANISALSEYSVVKPVLDAYENMYATGAAAIRAKLLEGSASATEAGVTFFESAVITGKVAVSDGGDSTSNTPTTPKTKTRFITVDGKELAPEEDGYTERKTFEGYEFVEVTTKNNVKTYVYKKVETPAPTPTVTEDTVWVKKDGNTLKPKESGTKPDTEGDDVPGYQLVSRETTTDSNGNKHTVNTYEKIEEKELPDTYWFDTAGNTLKPKAEDKTLPDTDGTSDIPGYKVVTVYTVKEVDVQPGGQFEKSGFIAGDTVNIYEKVEKPAKPVTEWVDEEGKPLKEKQEGTFPDKEGNDVPGYTLVSVTTDDNGNTKNVYKKTPNKPVTKWVDKEGKPLKAPKEGTFPDKEGDDIPGHKLISTKTDPDGNVTNVYEKVAEPITKWVDKEGKPLKDQAKGSFPDKEGDDIPGYKLVSTDVDADGNVVNTYRKIKTLWVDIDGKPLKDPQEGEYPDKEGDDIPGYKHVRTEPDKDGNIVNTYRKIITKWVDKEGKPLKDQAKGSFPDKEGDDIPGYKLVSTDVDADGNVVNVYEKVIKTSWVDESGKPLQNPKEGSFPDNDGKSDISGYELVGVKYDEDGNVINVYRKIAAPATPATPAPATPAPATPKATQPLPQTGDASSVLGVVGTTIGGLSAAGLGAKLNNRRKRSRK